MDEERKDDQLEPTYNSSVPIQDVALKTNQKRWTIEKDGGRGSRISVLMAQHDDDDFHEVSLNYKYKTGWNVGILPVKKKTKSTSAV